MAALPSIKELRAMNQQDLESELSEQTHLLEQIKLQVQIGSEKDTAKLRRLRKLVARMHTVQNEKATETLKKTPKIATVLAPTKS